MPREAGEGCGLGSFELVYECSRFLRRLVQILDVSPMYEIPSVMSRQKSPERKISRKIFEPASFEPASSIPLSAGRFRGALCYKFYQRQIPYDPSKIVAGM